MPFPPLGSQESSEGVAVEPLPLLCHEAHEIMGTELEEHLTRPPARVGGN